MRDNNRVKESGLGLVRRWKGRFSWMEITALCVALLLVNGCARYRRHLSIPDRAPSEAVSEYVPGIWPVDYPAMYMSSPYGEIRPGGRRHRGVDIAVPRGTPVMAAASGATVFAGRQGNYGNIIILCHGNGYETAYAHLDRILAKRGSRVRRGAVIGLVGATGNATGPHLHYEVRKNGVDINPMPYLP